MHHCASKDNNAWRDSSICGICFFRLVCFTTHTHVYVHIYEHTNELANTLFKRISTYEYVTPTVNAFVYLSVEQCAHLSAFLIRARKYTAFSLLFICLFTRARAHTHTNFFIVYCLFLNFYFPIKFLTTVEAVGSYEKCCHTFFYYIECQSGLFYNWDAQKALSVPRSVDGFYGARPV